MVNCPKCGVLFDNRSKWGLKKFCSRKCANSREQSDSLKEQKSKKLRGTTTVCVCEYCEQEFVSNIALRSHKPHCNCNPVRKAGTFFNKIHKEDTKRAIGLKNSMGLKVPSSLLDMSKRTTSKIMKRLNMGCFTCGWNEAHCDIHHIIPRSKGGSDDNDNLTYLCPNCHRLAHENKLSKFVSIKERIGEAWRAFYFAHE